MRVLLQRVSEASVRVEGRIVARIPAGLLLLVGVMQGDGVEAAERLAGKVAGLRIFPGDDGRFHRSLLDVGGAALVVSQFTLGADCRRGRRPSFSEAADPAVAEPLCDRFAATLRRRGVAPVESGVFGAHMEVALVNDGPVTLWLESSS